MPAASSQLSRRERQILDILYQRGRATAHEVRDGLADSPSYSTVRALLRILEEKGHVRHLAQGARYLYAPAVPRDRARRSALAHLLRTFFDGSPERAVATLLDISSERLSRDELDRMAALIDKARQEGK